MRAFSQLLDDLVYTRSRNTKLKLIGDYLKATPDPDRGIALAALTGTLDIPHVKPAVVRGLVEERIDPVLFRMSRDYVGDSAETISLLWQTSAEGEPEIDDATVSIAKAIERLRTASKMDAPKVLAELLDHLDASGRYALLKLAMGALRVGISARLAKQALADAFGIDVEAVEEVWHGLAPPYLELFDWAEGRGPQPTARDVPVFRPFMLAHPLEDTQGLARRLCRGVEVGRHSRAARSHRRPDPDLQPHRRRHRRKLSGDRRFLCDGRRSRRRIARARLRPGHGRPSRRGRRQLQRAPAKARPQERQPENARDLSGLRPAVRHPVRRAGRPARAGLDTIAGSGWSDSCRASIRSGSTCRS